MITPTLVLGAWLTVTRVAAIVLVATGMSPESARFQAWSAFTGTGFTTDEAEAALRHPVRRRVIRWLMFIGHAGLAAFAGTIILGLGRGHHDSVVTRALILGAGFIGLYLVSRISIVDKALERVTRWALVRATNLPQPLRLTPKIVELVTLGHGWMIGEAIVQENGWLTTAKLDDLALSDEGVWVLSVTRLDGGFEPAPPGEVELHAGESIVLHGPAERLADVVSRPGGDQGATLHKAAVDQYRMARRSGRSGG